MHGLDGEVAALNDRGSRHSPALRGERKRGEACACLSRWATSPSCVRRWRVEFGTGRADPLKTREQGAGSVARSSSWPALRFQIPRRLRS